MNKVRNNALHKFLRGIGWDLADFRALEGDASNRRYVRLHLDKRSAILMDAPPNLGEDVHPFAAMTHWLRSNGFSAPEICSGDYINGLLLLEDLGTRLYSPFLSDHPDKQVELYERAVDVLVKLSTCDVPDRVGQAPYTTPLPPYNADVLEREALLMTQWWRPAVTKERTSDTMRDDYCGLIAEICGRASKARDIVVLRDYHAENLIWLQKRSGIEAVGLLDYQDAVAGHPAYDLVSLLEDARRDTSEELRQHMIDYYLSRRPDLDAEEFLADYAALGAQRNLKIIGIFTRLGVRDGKMHYLKMIPRVWQHLQNDLQHPSLKHLRDWVAKNVPAPNIANLQTIRARATS